MKTQLLILGLFLLTLILPAELKRKDKHKKHGKHGRHQLIEEDPFFQIVDDPSEDDDDVDSEWLYELQDPDGHCSPNPCLNNGVCKEKEKGKRRFECDCPKPFKGKKCQQAPKVCKRGLCGRGECVLTSTPPYYECHCKESYLPPDCRTHSLCEPNPCQNGGTCVRDGKDFDCTCPEGFSGRFCHVGPDDCYEGNGESYRGVVSETDDEDECLHWNSHFILDRGIDPFNSYENDDGLGHHNYCRNPDGDKEPWCFIRRGLKLRWDYCGCTKCTTPTGHTPTTAKPHPTAAKPRPTTPKPQPTTAMLQPSTPTPAQFSTCGKPEPVRSIYRIYGGLKATPGSQPWQLSLQSRPTGTTGPYNHICGAVLIHSCWALTAGHCIDKKNSMQVVAGSLTLNATEPTEQTIEVEKVIVHENYRVSSTAVYNDIALLKLKAQAPDGSCATESQLVKTACLPETQLPDGKECTISGWGTTEESNFASDHLLDAQVLLIGQESCSDSSVYGSNLDDSMFCAGYLQGGVDSCKGDSGGPLTCQTGGSHAIYGLVSWGDSCAKANKPGVYTRVTHFLDWIKSKTQAAY